MKFRFAGCVCVKGRGRKRKSEFFGFVWCIADDITCVPDRLLWGGIGTLMEVDIEECMAKHTAEVKNLKNVSPAVMP